MKKNLLNMLILATFMPIFLISCKKPGNTVAFNSTINLQIAPTGQTYQKEKTLVHYDGGSGEKIGVLLGWGFNEEENIELILQELDSVFGLAEKGGIIVPCVFPKDLRGRILNLRQFYDDYKLKGMILLGSPEKTHLAVGYIEDDYRFEDCFNVFSLFPQDDLLGQEGISVFVVEEERDISEGVEAEEFEQTFDPSYVKMLVNSLMFMNNLPSTLPQNRQLENYVKYCVRKNNLAHFVDSETGLQSVHHFIIPKGKQRRK